MVLTLDIGVIAFQCHSVILLVSTEEPEYSRVIEEVKGVRDTIVTSQLGEGEIGHYLIVGEFAVIVGHGSLEVNLSQ